MKENKSTSGTLYIVSTPIGNDDDISLRAVKVLQTVDTVVCEEAKIGARLLHKLNIKKDIEILNEQNEFEKAPEIITLLTQGSSLALISDCGSPVFADPGLELVQQALSASINIVVIPGATSIMTALVRSGFDISSFLFAGFLSRTKEERKSELERLARETRTVVLFETPYRLMPLLEAALKIMPYRNAYIACNLTMPFETHHYGTFADLYKKFEELNFKGEFVIVFDKATEKFVAEGHSGFNPRFKSNDKFSSEKTGNFRDNNFGRERSDRERPSRDSGSRGGRDSYKSDRFSSDRKPSYHNSNFKSNYKSDEDKGSGFGERTPRYDDRKPRFDDKKPRYDDRKPRYDDRKPKSEDRSSRFDDKKPRYDDRKPRFDDKKPRYDDRKPRPEGFSDKPSYGNFDNKEGREKKYGVDRSKSRSGKPFVRGRNNNNTRNKFR
jgi:16S rRNA (cytidine1402-2'-O)-methyltransferase